MRVMVALAAWPTMFEWLDAVRYARVYPKGLFSDFWMPAGYPVFLDMAHAADGNLGFTILLQHALGIVTAILFYLISRNMGVNRPLSLIPCAVVLLSGDFIYLEHILMGDTFYLFVMTLAVYLFVRALERPSNAWRFGIAGVVAGLACLTRTTALVLPVVLFVWLAFVPFGSERTSRTLFVRLASFGLPVVAVLVGYLGVANAIGPYAGLFDMGGFHLYARVAPFANCSKFTPPPHTARLCQTTAPQLRDGPEYYEWDPSSPVRRSFPLSPATAQVAGTFAKAVLVHQPLDYLKAVGLDLARYVDPSLGHLPTGYGESHNLMSFSNFNPKLEQELARELSTRYSGASPPSTRWLADLADVQGVVRVDTGVMILLLLAMFGGLVFGDRNLRVGLWAMSALTFFLFLGPVAAFTYDIRYGIPPQAFLALAATLGVQSIWTRFEHRSAAEDGEPDHPPSPGAPALTPPD